jgi:hypothetical protein
MKDKLNKEVKIIRNKRDRKNGIANKVFEYLKDVSLGILDLTVTLVVDHKAIIKKTSYGNVDNFSKSYYYFKHSPYFKEIDNKIYVTPKGREKIIKNSLKDKLNKEIEWNGFWLAIAFDIPEKKRRARELLRRELRTMHFVEAQKSIWVTPYDVEKELLVLLKLWQKDLGGNIMVFKIDKITDDTNLKKHFEIK